MTVKYDIRDINLAPYGHTKIEWVRNNMPLLSAFEEEFLRTKPFEGVKISLSIHLEAKTAYLCKVLAAGGAQMGMIGGQNAIQRLAIGAGELEIAAQKRAVHAPLLKGGTDLIRQGRGEQLRRGVHGKTGDQLAEGNMGADKALIPDRGKPLRQSSRGGVVEPDSITHGASSFHRSFRTRKSIPRKRNERNGNFVFCG